MPMQPQSLLLAAENIPHYINYATRRRVLNSYRELQRNIGKLADPIARKHLRLLAQHNFAGYKFVTDSKRVIALLEYSEKNEFKWADLAAQNRIKEISKLLEIAFTTFGVKETPLKRILAKPPKLCDHKALYYKLNNINKPHVSTFEDHEAIMKEVRTQQIGRISEPYWILVKLMLSNSIKFGNHRRRLHFWPEDIVKSTVTAFGKPIVPSRQKNTLERLYEKFLRDAVRPVHPEILEYMDRQIQSSELPRLYRRRFQELADQLYTVDGTGKLIAINSIGKIEPATSH